MVDLCIDPTITVTLSWPDPDDPDVTLTLDLPPDCVGSGAWWNQLAFPDFDYRKSYAPPSSWIPGQVLLSVTAEAAALPITVAVRGTSVADLETQKATVSQAMSAEDLVVTITSDDGVNPPVILGEYDAEPALPRWGPIVPQRYGLVVAEGIASWQCQPPEVDELEVSTPDVGGSKGDDGEPGEEDPGPGDGDDSAGGDPEAPEDKIGMPDPGDLYLGVSKLVTGRETYMGQRFGMHRTFWNDSNSSTNSLVSTATSDIAIGRVPHVSVKLSVTWAAAAGGARDAYVSGLCTRLTAIGGGPIWLTIHHEPADDTGPGQSAEDYVAMYEHFKSITDAHPRIWLVPCISAGYWQISGGGGIVVSDWMSSAGSDAFALDCYVPWSPVNGKPFTTVDQTFRLGGIAQCLDLDPAKPIIIAEMGARTKPPAGTVTDWMNDAYEYLRTHNVIGASWFDSAANSPDGPFTLDRNYQDNPESPAERLGAYRDLLHDAHSVLIPPGGLA